MKNLSLYGVVATKSSDAGSLIIEEIQEIKQGLTKEYETAYAALSTPFDSGVVAQVKETAKQIKLLNPTLLLLVGIGGSNMGTLAIVQALFGTMLNEISSGIKFYCADTIDNNYDDAFLSIVEKEFASGGNVVICIVTKSGTTTETLINGSLFVQMLKNHRPDDYQKFVVCITDKNAPIWTVAQENSYMTLEVPKKVGGRYSVFSAVGLFPLALLDVDIDQLCLGARETLNECLHADLSINPAAQSALLLYEHYKAGYMIHDLFVFAPDLFMLGNWYKQLIGESLGKKIDREGKIVEVGFTPVVSVGTTDLHSVAQLYWLALVT